MGRQRHRSHGCSGRCGSAFALQLPGPPPRDHLLQEKTRDVFATKMVRMGIGESVMNASSKACQVKGETFLNPSQVEPLLSARRPKIAQHAPMQQLDADGPTDDTISDSIDSGTFLPRGSRRVGGAFVCVKGKRQVVLVGPRPLVHTDTPRQVTKQSAYAPMTFVRDQTAADHPHAPRPLMGSHELYTGWGVGWGCTSAALRQSGITEDGWCGLTPRPHVYIQKPAVADGQPYAQTRTRSKSKNATDGSAVSSNSPVFSDGPSKTGPERVSPRASPTPFAEPLRKVHAASLAPSVYSPETTKRTARRQHSSKAHMEKDAQEMEDTLLMDAKVQEEVCPWHEELASSVRNVLLPALTRGDLAANIEDMLTAEALAQDRTFLQMQTGQMWAQALACVGADLELGLHSSHSAFDASSRRESEVSCGRVAEDVLAHASVAAHSELVSASTPASIGDRQPSDSQEVTLCQCGNALLADAAFCRKCGTKRPEVTLCQCGNALLADAAFCRKCGTKRPEALVGGQRPERRLKQAVLLLTYFGAKKRLDRMQRSSYEVEPTARIEPGSSMSSPDVEIRSALASPPGSQTSYLDEDLEDRVLVASPPPTPPLIDALTSEVWSSLVDQVLCASEPSGTPPAERQAAIDEVVGDVFDSMVEIVVDEMDVVDSMVETVALERQAAIDEIDSSQGVRQIRRVSFIEAASTSGDSSMKRSTMGFRRRGTSTRRFDEVLHDESEQLQA